MKNLFRSFLALGVTLAGVTFGQAPAKAGAMSFECSISYPENGSLITTYAQTEPGRFLPVIRWTSQHFTSSGYTPQERCEQVSARFDRLNQQGMLASLSSGWLNGQPVICAGTYCSSDTLLFTLRTDQNPNQVLWELNQNRSNSSVVSYQTVGGSVTISLDEILDGLEPETPMGFSAGASTQAPAAAPVAPTPAPSSGGGW